MMKTPEEKHLELLERELARHALGPRPDQGQDEDDDHRQGREEAFRRGLEALPRMQSMFGVNPLIDPVVNPEGESVELTLASGLVATVSKDGEWTARVDGEVREFESLDRLIFDEALRKAISERMESVPYLEVRTFGKWSEHLDEIVASRAEVSVRRTGRREFIIQVNDELFRMDTADSERWEDAAQGEVSARDTESHGPRMIFLCTEREGYGPAEDAGEVDHYPERETPETGKGDIDHTGTQKLDGVEARGSHLHIEQMSTRDFWAGIGQGSYSFVMDQEGGAGIRLRRVHPSEAERLRRTD